MKWIYSAMVFSLLLALVACGGDGAEMAAVEPTEEVVALAIEATELPVVVDVASLEPAEEPLPKPTLQLNPTVAVAEEVSAAGGEANADVVWVRAIQTGDSWTFHVTVAHPDTGWEDYADGWDVVLPDGSVLKPAEGSPFTRLLTHPHETEQPFTRSQGGIIIPAGVTTVTVRAHDLVDGFGGQEIAVDLTTSAGQGFEVERP